MNYDEIDYEKLRYDLMNFFGTASPVYQVAIMDLINIESASEEELLKYALSYSFDLNEYKKNGYSR